MTSLTVVQQTQSKQSGLRKGEVRASLLTLLRREPHTVTELSKLLGVSKATVSYHLNNMLRGGQIRVISEEGPIRGFIKKYYQATKLARSPLEERYVEMLRGMGENARRELRHCQLETLGAEIKNIIMGALHILQYVTTEKHAQLLKDLGFQIGVGALCHRIPGRRLPSILKGVKQVLEGSKLGVVSVVESTTAKATVRIYDCFECVNVPNIGEIQCSFDEGALSGVIQTKLGADYAVQEVKCQGTGDPYCEFRVKRLKERQPKTASQRLQRLTLS